MPESFHFLEPRWLLALIPLLLLLWALKRFSSNDNPWKNLIAPDLQPLLLNSTSSQSKKSLLYLLAAGWLIAVIALANPAWEKQPRPLVRSNAARVIVLDLSLSMNSRDLKPSRMERARFKVEDILATDNEGQTGLVVFAGDAFTVSPLTHDMDTIRSLLSVLSPGIMPVQGSNASAGLSKAHELLQGSGFSNGQIILIADGVTDSKAANIAGKFNSASYTVSVLGVGTLEGAPILTTRGRPLTDKQGNTVTAPLEIEKLKAVALKGGGQYASISTDSTDLQSILTTNFSDISSSADNNAKKKDTQGFAWKSQGAYFVILLLPLAALAFRRGWLVSLALLIGLSSIPGQSMAFDWKDLWQRKDQQADAALKANQYEAVKKLSDRPDQLGTAAYKEGDYEQALKYFNKNKDAHTTYNKGNSLAKTGKYKEAISAYDNALNKQPNMEDAKFNKSSIEKFLEQQEQQKQQSSDSGDSEEQQQDDQEQDNEQQKSNDGQQNEDQQQQEKDQQSGESQKQSDKQPSEEKNPFADANKEMNKAEEQENTEPESGEKEAEADNPNPQSKQQAKEQAEDQADQEETEEQQAQPATAEELSSEEKMAAEQWLRRIPDDPGGLLRRKFYYQYRNRDSQQSPSGNPW